MSESSVARNGAGAPRMAGRKVLITGAASGIGRATAELFAREGAALVLLDSNAGQLGEAASQVGGVALPGDLLDSAAIPALVDSAAQAMGGLDGVVNCAARTVAALLGELTLDNWSKTLLVNLTAPYLISRAALPHFRPGSSIVNVASASGLRPDTPGGSAYAASKGGLITFSKALANELAPHVRVNVVCPGLTDTPLSKRMLKGHEDPSTAPAVTRLPLKRQADPVEIARAILFLASDEASYVTGATLAVDGGRTFH